MKLLLAAALTGSLTWPTRTWTVRTQAPETAAACEAMRALAFPAGEVHDRARVRTDALLLVRGGEIIHETYGRGFDETTKHQSWSVAKSITNALVGIAVRDGLLSLDDKVETWYPKLARPAGQRPLTVRDLLYMMSGIRWSETYEDSPIESSVVRMLYFPEGQADMPRFAESQGLGGDGPGTAWQYNSGNTNLLMGILHQKLGEAHAAWPWRVLFDRMNVGATFEQDRAGNFVGSSYLYATPRDFAKLGLLFLRDGMWEGERILPEGWMAMSRQVSPAYALPGTKVDPKNPGLQGAHFWLNVAVPERGMPQPYPSAPPDLFAGSGHWGQFLGVIPSRDLVVVRLGDDREVKLDIDALLKHALECAGKSQ